MSWSTGERIYTNETKQQLMAYGGPTQVLQAWQKIAEELTALRDREAALRKASVELFFANPTEGVNRYELGNGWSLKADIKYTYNLTNKQGETEKAIDALIAISQQAQFIADRLIKWTPELSIKEYRLLNPDNTATQTEEQKRILAVLQPILTIKPGMPQLAIEAPKGTP